MPCERFPSDWKMKVVSEKKKYCFDNTHDVTHPYKPLNTFKVGIKVFVEKG